MLLSKKFFGRAAGGIFVKIEVLMHYICVSTCYVVEQLISISKYQMSCKIRNISNSKGVHHPSIAQVIRRLTSDFRGDAFHYISTKHYPRFARAKARGAGQKVQVLEIFCA